MSNYTHEYEATANKHEAEAVLSTAHALTHIRHMHDLDAIDILNHRMPVLHITCEDGLMMYINTTHITAIRMLD